MAVIEITQADRDRNRRKNHFQVRLDDDLANKLRHFMQSRNYNANQALSTIDRDWETMIG